MIDIGLSKMALVGAVALIVIGPEKLPGVARTLGALIGKAQRYVADVKAEVNQAMALDELRRMKDSVESAARDVQHSMSTTAADLEKQWRDTARLGDDLAGADEDCDVACAVVPAYRHPGKNFRLKRTAIPRWYKLSGAAAGRRTHLQSGAARVARFRPPKR